MGCFLGCFGGAKAKRGRRPKNLPRNTNLERQEFQLPPCSVIVPTYSLNPLGSEIQGISALEEHSEVVIKGKAEKAQNLNPLKPKIRKKVSFDPQVKTYEEIPSQDELEVSTEKKGKEVAERELGVANPQNATPTEDQSSADTAGSFGASYRYQNCTNSDDEVDDDITDDDYDDYDEDDDDDDGDLGNEREVLFEWYSSPSFESETKDVSPPSIGKEADITNARPIKGIGHTRERSQYVHDVLNPVANVSEWKELKSRDPKDTSLLKERKENVLSREETLIKLNSGQEIHVDASLSNWLSPTENVAEINYPCIAESKNTQKSKDAAKREVFGVLTNEKVTGNWDKPLVVGYVSSKHDYEIKGTPNTVGGTKLMQ